MRKRKLHTSHKLIFYLNGVIFKIIMILKRLERRIKGLRKDKSEDQRKRIYEETDRKRINTIHKDRLRNVEAIQTKTNERDRQTVKTDTTTTNSPH